ncbi:MAG: deoxyguanosinetriphosphate triphosphohydrolase [Clostridia bacterium]|nr:deoxyguanosinetriphosphate triphosphohydrolase [Clostridia bacterium]
MLIRERIEQREREILSPLATLSINTRGRKRPEPKCSVRTEFQRDRDRIIHSKAFRRLKHKTQVFLAPEGDHFRTRLTHTLEVTQIARTIARGLNLNEDLTEAIALGHDLGHTPFGHSGEEVLKEIVPGGFKHNEQSLRVVDYLEGEGGLNLTQEVRDGILNHTGPKKPFTLEGQIVKIADRIAYINHDIDDAIRAGVLKKEDQPAELLSVLGKDHSRRINTMVTDIIKNSDGKREIKMSPPIEEATYKLREFLFDNVYKGSSAKAEEGKAKRMLKELYFFYLENPEALPLNIRKKIGEIPTEQLVCDYIAGMTDRYAISQYQIFFVPRGFSLMCIDG